MLHQIVMQGNLIWMQFVDCWICNRRAVPHLYWVTLLSSGAALKPWTYFLGMRVFLDILHHEGPGCMVSVQWQKKVFGAEFLEGSSVISIMFVFPWKHTSFTQQGLIGHSAEKCQRGSKKALCFWITKSLSYSQPPFTYKYSRYACIMLECGPNRWGSVAHTPVFNWCL